MNLAALPYTTFLLLLQFAAGCQAVLLLVARRDDVSKGFVKTGACMIPIAAILALWTSSIFVGVHEIAGYPLDDAWLTPLRVTTALFALLSLIYNWFVWREQRARSMPWGWATTIAGIAAVGCVAAFVRLPTWGYPVTVLSLLAGAGSLGAVTMGMMLGHWYLVTPRLPEAPLNRVTLALFIILAAQLALVLVAVILPARIIPSAADDPAGSLGQNPFFWLRMGVGLLFPLALAYMAWQSSVIRSMMSATGLLYIAMGGVLAGEVLARALLFSTARPL